MSADNGTPGCVLFAALLAYKDGDLPEAERKTLERHTAACKSCRTRLDILDLEGLAPFTAASRMRPEGECPPLEDLAAFLLGSVGREESKRMEEHLSLCLGCLTASGLLYEEVPLPKDAGPLTPAPAALERFYRLLDEVR